MDLDSELGRLHGADLGDFVAERTKLARLLRAEGLRAEAAAVEKLRKPSLVVWTVNQLARRNGKEIERLLDAGDRLGAEQVALLGERGDSKAFEKARERERQALSQLRRAAMEILGERASAGTLDRVVATLRAAAVSSQTRGDLARGWLKDEVAPVGFEALAGATPASTSARKRAARERATKPAALTTSRSNQAEKIA